MQRQISHENGQFLPNSSQARHILNTFYSHLYPEDQILLLVPWEKLDSLRLGDFAGATSEYDGEKLRREELGELGRVFEAQKLDELQWVLEDDLEISEEVLNGEKKVWTH